MAIDTKQRNYDKLNPGQQDYERDFTPDAFKDRKGSNRPLDDLEAAEQAGAATSQDDDLQSQESKSPWTTSVSSPLSKLKGKQPGKRKAAIIMGIISLIVSIAAFFAFLPLKLVNLMENFKEAASHLVERPIEKRMQYLVSRYLAGKIVAGTDKNRFDEYTCPDGGVTCAVLATWYLAKMEDKLGFTIESNQDGSGGATKWIIRTIEGVEVEGEGGDFETVLRQVEREINGSRAMRQFLRDELKKETKWHNAYKRYALRKMLMRKYGVKGWRGPEKLEQKFDTYEDKKRAYKKALKIRLVKATVARVSAKTALYLNCLIESGDPNCKDLQNDEASPPAADEAEQNEKDQAAQAKGRAGANEIAGNSDINADLIEDIVDQAGSSADASKVATKIITNKLLAGSLAGVGLISIIATAVEKIDQGAPNAIIENARETAYAGLAVEFSTSADKFKENDLDPENLQAIGEILGNLEQSPLAQHELGINKSVGTAANPAIRDCDEDGKTEALPEGELVCPNKKITADVTSIARGFPAWDAVIVPVATAWNNSAGAVLDAINAIAGAVLDAIGINDAIAWIIDATGLGAIIEDLAGLILQMFIGSPITGLEENGAAYDALSIGTKVSYNGMMKNGVDQNGEGMGAGGKALSEAELEEAELAAKTEALEEFNQQPLMARIFDPYLPGSVLHTLSLRTPSNLSGLIAAPLSQAAAMATPTANAFPYRNENPAGIVFYGYPENDPVYSAPPETYTPETCEEMAELRDESYGREEGEISPRFHRTDPCALEKVVCVAATAKYNGDCAQEFNLYSGTQPMPQEPPQGNPQPGEYQWPISPVTAGTITQCWGLSTHHGIDIAAPVGTDIVAAMDGQVLFSGSAGGYGNYIAIKHANGTNTGYGHNSQNLVKAGDTVRQGQVIAKVGNEGQSSGPHLHLNLMPNNSTIFTKLNDPQTTINPLRSFIKPPQVRDQPNCAGRV